MFYIYVITFLSADTALEIVITFKAVFRCC